MKTRIATALASLLIASMGTAAYAQGAQQTTPQTMPPTTSGMQSDQSMSNGDMKHSNMSKDRIEQKVKRELTSHGVTATNVNVAFDNGTATLSGTVATESDIGKAKSAALRVRGVKHVDTSNLHARAEAGAMHH